MAVQDRARLAAQVRGHLELLGGGGVRHIAIKRKKPAARAKGGEKQPPGRPGKAVQQQPERKPAGKPVIVRSVAMEELSAHSGGQATELAGVAEEVRTCDRCGLCSTRTQTVFGTGHPSSPLMIVGEAPGGDEDAKGIPFVGRAGKLLTDIIEKGMGYKREHVYICNVLKCRPPMNRNPLPEEIEACRGFLKSQIEIINPKVILAVGRFPAQWLTGLNIAIGQIRGKVHEAWGRKVIATYHPAYVLRNYTVETRKKVHQDVLLAVEILGKPPLIAE